MALKTKISVTESNGNMVFKETTGLYSLTNPYGWGTNNPVIADATTAGLVVTDPDGTEHEFNMFDSSFPTSDTSQEYVLSPEDLLQSGTKLRSGVYKVKYTVTVDGTEYEACEYFFLDEKVLCKIDTLLSQVSPSQCSVPEFDLLNLHVAAKIAFSKGHNEKANSILDYLDSQSNC